MRLSESVCTQACQSETHRTSLEPTCIAPQPFESRLKLKALTEITALVDSGTQCLRGALTWNECCQQTQRRAKQHYSFPNAEIKAEMHCKSGESWCQGGESAKGVQVPELTAEITTGSTHPPRLSGSLMFW